VPTGETLPASVFSTADPLPYTPLEYLKGVPDVKDMYTFAEMVTKELVVPEATDFYSLKYGTNEIVGTYRFMPDI
jgi:hypothetical protein